MVISMPSNAVVTVAVEIPPKRHSLYDIVTDRADLRAVLDMIDQEDNPEAFEELTRQLEALTELELPAKVENICRIVRNIEARGSMIERERERLKARAQTCDNKVAHLKDYLRFCLDTAQLKRVSAGIFDVSIRQNGGKQAVNRDFIEHELRSGHDVPGVTVEQRPVTVIDEKLLPDDYKLPRGSHLHIS